ncbi:MAG: NADH:flavin oxidoreductase, partial [Chloroflexi bacterium]|nr:NADH:flavin oxidoreductase [Chloroflexota bacterium]
MPHERFRYKSLEELLAAASALGLKLPAAEDLAPLARRVRIGSRWTPNALTIHPMEGCDGAADGRPDELTFRRYVRFARGGAGLLWFEATAIVQEGRANPRQLLLTPDSAPAFARLREEALAAGREVNGSDYQPLTTLQLTHSGRYSRPVDKPAPIIAHHDGLLDKALGIPEDHALISDEALDRLQDRWVEAARLAQACGYDGVDIKSCHRYLLSELLAAHTRPGRYGGSFENRTRLLRSVVQRVRDELPDLALTIRLNVYDGHPYPWGWGVSREDPTMPDMTEPLRLIGLLREAGAAAINITAGNPYYTPHINRPFDQNVVGGYTPDEHPLVGVARLIGLARQAKEAYPDLVVMGTGYSWLRQYLGNVAAAVLARGWADLVGVGRGAFAYPDYARDLLTQGAMDPRKCCITCSRCTQIMRDHGRSGCVPLDREVYGPIYRQGRQAH